MKVDKLFFDLSESVHKEIDLDKLNENLRKEINIEETKAEIKKVLDSVVKPLLDSVSKKDLETITSYFEDKIENLKNTATAVFKEEGNAFASASLDLALCSYVIKYEKKLNKEDSVAFKTEEKKGNKFTNFFKKLFKVDDEKNM